MAVARSVLTPVAAVLSIAAVACGGPFLMLPGGRLSGDVHAAPVTDWAFVDSQFVDLEVRPDDPYSVELNYTVVDGRLYIDPAEGRKWLDYLREDDRARVRFGDTVYPVKAVLIGGPGEVEGFDTDRYIYRLDSRSASD